MSDAAAEGTRIHQAIEAWVLAGSGPQGAPMPSALSGVRYAGRNDLGHFYATDIEWDEEPGVMRSWTPVRCSCSEPWRHQRLV